MIKKFFGIIPLLLLTSCSSGKTYYNVEYKLVSRGERFYYNVEIPEDRYPNVKDRKYTLTISEVFHVYVDQYYCTETCESLAYNEFYVGLENKLVIYIENK